MNLPPSQRSALRAYLAREFATWVEDVLSRDELPLWGSALPAMTHPQPRRGNKKKTTKAKAKKDKAKAQTTPEEDKSSAPAAPAPEDQRPAPAASTPEEDVWKTARNRRSKRRRQAQDTSQMEPQPGKRSRAAPTTPRTSSSTTATKSRSRQCHHCQGYGHTTRGCTNDAICAQCSGSHPSIECISQRQEGIPPTYFCDLCMEEGHGRRSRFCKNRPRPAAKSKTQDEETMDVTPAATCDAATQADIPIFRDLQAFQPNTGNADHRRERDWFKDTDPVTLDLLPEDAVCQVQVTEPYFDARPRLQEALATVKAVHCRPPDKCGSREHLYQITARNFHALYAGLLDAHDDFRAARPKHPQPVAVALQSIQAQGKSLPMTTSTPCYPKIIG